MLYPEQNARLVTSELIPIRDSFYSSIFFYIERFWWLNNRGRWKLYLFNLSFDEGGGVDLTQVFLFIFLLKTLSYTLRPTCIFLI